MKFLGKESAVEFQRPPLASTGKNKEEKKLVENKLDEKNDLLCRRFSSTNYVVCRLMNFLNFLKRKKSKHKKKKISAMLGEM